MWLLYSFASAKSKRLHLIGWSINGSLAQNTMATWPGGQLSIHCSQVIRNELIIPNARAASRGEASCLEYAAARSFRSDLCALHFGSLNFATLACIFNAHARNNYIGAVEPIT